MAPVFDDLELSLMTFPQRWESDGITGKLFLQFLLLPVGDPLTPLSGGPGPQFAGTSVNLTVKIVAGADALPTTASATAFSKAFVATPPTVATTLFNTLKAQSVAKGATVTSGALPAYSAKARIQKGLPPSYTEAFAFEASRTADCTVGDGYGCALRAQDPGLLVKKTPPTIAWGQIISFALRQPELARALGLTYARTLDVPVGTLAGGGYVYIQLDDSSPTNPWVADLANPFKVKSYAARLPNLAANGKRSLFAATLLPILATAPGNLTDSQFEAEQYDDGFAQIVHSNQPTTVDAASLDSEQIAPGAEAGVQIGWDDEQVTIWLNNQLDMLGDRVQSRTTPGFTLTKPESPLGVQGYRVDVRLKGATTWRSLCGVNGSLPFDNSAIGSPAKTSINGTELWVAPVPIRALPIGGDSPAWLPLYFAHWKGSSLVVDDPATTQLLSALIQPDLPVPAQAPQNPSADLSGVPILRYGNDYEFRVRLVDLAGGSPRANDPIIHPGAAPQALCKFRRFIPPKALEVESLPAVPPLPNRAPAVRTIDTITIQRPHIGYPEAVFAGVDPSTFSSSNLQTLIEGARTNGRSVGIPDPDVDRFEVRVEARIPSHDIGTSGTLPDQLDGSFRVIYSVVVHFPTDAGDDPTVTLNFNYTDGVDDISTMDPPADDSTDLPIPTARDVRIRLFPLCADRANYYGTVSPPVGSSSDFIVRKEAVREDAVFPNIPQTQLQAFYFQPGTNVPQLLAQKLELDVQDLTISGSPGKRVVFGCSGALRHNISPDFGSLTFSSQAELLGHWIVVLAFDLERDWTWDGFKNPAIQFDRVGETAPIGTMIFPSVVADQAAGSLTARPERSRSRLVFLDALNPLPAPGKFPRELHPTYRVTASFDEAVSQQYSLDIRLPITTPPAQTPKIASTGIAQTTFHHSDDYSETSLRERYLWVEFDQPITDKDDDAYFARVLAYGPDPLLSAKLYPTSSPNQMLPNKEPEPALAVDPESMRYVFSGQASDESGLDAMTELLPASNVGVGKSGKFFLLLLPQAVSVEALELFGFWTYEFRLGHRKYWSTAQGRFGRPLRLAGVQHPSPHLLCSVQRDKTKIGATAPYAVTVYNGSRVFDFTAGDPQTSLWFLLYAQVRQADNASYRNVLLARRQGKTILPQDDFPIFNEKREVVYALNRQHGRTREARAAVSFTEDEVESLLRRIDLPKTSSLSLLAVEVLPGEPRIFSQGDQVPGVPPNREPKDVQQLDEDPLGRQLGKRRVLRVSPLTAVPSIC